LVYQDLCVELELEDWVKQERKQHGLTESTMTLTPPEIVAALVADVKKRAEAQLGMVSTAHHRTQPSTLGLELTVGCGAGHHQGRYHCSARLPRYPTPANQG
jgi:hypothetical protein